MSAPSCIAVPTERFAHSRVAHSPASQSPVSPSPVAVADTHTHSPSRRSNTPKSQVQHRYSEFIQVTKTLQGIGFVLEMVEYACAFRKTIWSSTSCICRSTLIPYGQKLVIKIADSRLASLSLGIVNGRESTVHENILDEARILQYLTNQPRCPDSIVKFINFYQSSDAHHLVMEDGGHSLFDFVQRAHKLIQMGHLSIPEWLRVIKIIFKQMLEAVEFLHSMNTSHFDISLENFVINDVGIEPKLDRQSGANRIHFCGKEGVQIKLCDFGLAVFFPKVQGATKTSFHSRKFVGKSRYWSPELSAHHTFDARANDIWCLGVCLFMMATGTAPFETASGSDSLFCMIINGQIPRVLKSWNLTDRVDESLLELLSAIFKYEAQRATVQQIQKCSWLR